MATFIPDGIYKIRNVEFNIQVAELYNGIPFGPIVGGFENGSPIELWRIVNQGVGGNQITIESVSIPGIFANGRQSQGANLVGASNSMIWTVVKADNGYYLQSPDANFVWQIPAYNNLAIVLVHHTAEDNTKWIFEHVDE